MVSPYSYSILQSKSIVSEYFETNIQQVDIFVKQQQEGIRLMVEEKNSLYEYLNVLIAAKMMIFGASPV